MRWCMFCGTTADDVCVNSRDVEDMAEMCPGTERGSRCLSALARDRSLGERGYDRVLMAIERNARCVTSDTRDGDAID